LIVELRFICNESAYAYSLNNFTWHNKDYSQECVKTATFVGKEACPMIDWTFIKAYYSYGNTILLLVSLFLIFAGSKFLLWVMTAASFFLGWVAPLFLAMNLELVKDPRIPDENVDSETFEADWTLVGIAIAITLVIGFITAFMLYKLFKKSLTWSLGGSFGFFIIYTMLPRVDAIGIVICCLGAITGGYIGRRLDRILKTFCTAAVGSILLV